MISYIDEHREEHGVEPICRTLTEAGMAIAPLTYYASKTRPESERSKRDAVLDATIAELHKGNHDVYGVRKMWHLLQQSGWEVARCTVSRRCLERIGDVRLPLRSLGRRSRTASPRLWQTNSGDLTAFRHPPIVGTMVQPIAPAAIWYEAAGKLGDLYPSIRPIAGGLLMAGPAYTVKCLLGDTSAVLRAIDDAASGSVLVVDAGGTDRSTAWGGTSSRAAALRGLAGCVTNGSVRDVDEVRRVNVPVFAAGISVRGTLKHHPGWSGLTVSVGGVSVSPGDWVVGDSDGVVVVPQRMLDEVARRVVDQLQREADVDHRLEAGGSLKEILGLN